MSGNDAIVAIYYIQGCEDVRRGEVNNRACVRRTYFIRNKNKI